MRKIWKVVHNRTKVSLAASSCALAGNGRDTLECPITSDARGRGVPKHRRLPVRFVCAKILAIGGKFGKCDKATPTVWPGFFLFIVIKSVPNQTPGLSSEIFVCFLNRIYILILCQIYIPVSTYMSASFDF